MFKTGSTLTITYQAVNAGSGKIILMEVYDESHSLDSAQSNTIGLTEIASTGRYYDTIIPDAEGEWTVFVWEKIGAKKKGQVVKTFRIVSHDVESVGDAVVTVDSKVTAVKTKTDNLPSDPASESQIEAAVIVSETSIRGADSDTLKTLSDQIDAFESPAMVG